MEPVSEDTFKVPASDFPIDSEKIKQLALGMEINAPEWAKDEGVYEERIRKLFEKK